MHGYELGVAHHGGFAEYARVPAEWVVPLPDGLSARQAMAMGTAGYTAALSVYLLEERGGLEAGAGPVLVTGASGRRGEHGGRHPRRARLRGRREHRQRRGGRLPARARAPPTVIARDETSAASERPLESERWAGAVDAVGGATLAYVLRTLRRGAAVAASGNTGGFALETTVLPFILRGVSLLGADSVNTPIDLRRELWGRIATDLRPRGLDDSITREVALDDLEPVLDAILRGEVRGRTVVRLAG